MELPEYTDGKRRYLLKERGLVSAIDGNSEIGYVQTVSVEEFLSSLAVSAGYKPGDLVEYYILVRRKR